MRDDNDVLTVSQLSVTYPGRAGRSRGPVVNDVSFSIPPRTTLALVGESGSGKTTIGRAVLGLAPVTSGRILLGGVDITSHRKPSLVSRELQAVFQDPYSSLNPRKTIGESLQVPLMAQRGTSRAEARKRIAELLERVGLPADSRSRYPAMFSGGQRQRIAIARALVLRPKLMVCDEPTSALDVSTQASVLALLQELRDEMDTSYLFITHDLAVVRHFADRVAVLGTSGTIVESGTPEAVCDNPQHPYTQRLVISAPVPHPALQRQRREQRLAFSDTH
jgi:ABC-type glutathione transport system ATPase component